MDGWHFTSSAEAWRWHCVDEAGELIKASSRSFPSLIECISDAMKNGYSIIVAGPVRARADGCAD